jgi:hypothetical protein
VSDELARHHVAQHACIRDEGADAHVAECPCEVAVAIVCGSCGEPLLLSLAPDEWCEHAETMATARGLLP